ncbi:MAG: hypothetical protein JOZ90_04065 [Alphaproteobacteria bacterium]|nr:hypothetical protein [Alphaproteobacteria bacterium]MBV9373167.1 hypothetical protein [Alphaproteobacteria bacterium]MBV9900256.1 hypothetical protein [Alphaproteobacteria bacterium]
MTEFEGQDMLVGLVAFGTVLWILWTLKRGLGEARLPIGRAYVRRDERPGAFRLLFGVYVAAALLIAFISLDLLLHIKTRFA